jgi:hypothetical protein
MRKMGGFVGASGTVLVLLAACAAKPSTGGFGGSGDDAAPAVESEGGSSGASGSGSSSGSGSGSSGGSSGSSGSSSGSSSGASSGSGSGSSGGTADDAGSSTGGGDAGAPTCAKLAPCCPLIMMANAQLGMACTQAVMSNSESLCQMGYTMAKAQDPLCM